MPEVTHPQYVEPTALPGKRKERMASFVKSLDSESGNDHFEHLEKLKSEMLADIASTETKLQHCRDKIKATEHKESGAREPPEMWILKRRKKILNDMLVFVNLKINTIKDAQSQQAELRQLVENDDLRRQNNEMSLRNLEINLSALPASIDSYKHLQETLRAYKKALDSKQGNRELWESSVKIIKARMESMAKEIGRQQGEGKKKPERVRPAPKTTPKKKKVDPVWGRKAQNERAAEIAKENLNVHIVKRGDTLGAIVKGLTKGKFTWGMAVDYRSDKLKGNRKPKKLADANLIYPKQKVWIDGNTIVVADKKPEVKTPAEQPETMPAAEKPAAQPEPEAVAPKKTSVLTTPPKPAPKVPPKVLPKPALKPAEETKQVENLGEYNKAVAKNEELRKSLGDKIKLLKLGNWKTVIPGEMVPMDINKLKAENKLLEGKKSEVEVAEAEAVKLESSPVDRLRLQAQYEVAEKSQKVEEIKDRISYKDKLKKAAIKYAGSAAALKKKVHLISGRIKPDIPWEKYTSKRFKMLSNFIEQDIKALEKYLTESGKVSPVALNLLLEPALEPVQAEFEPDAVAPTKGVDQAQAEITASAAEGTETAKLFEKLDSIEFKEEREGRYVDQIVQILEQNKYVFLAPIPDRAREEYAKKLVEICREAGVRPPANQDEIGMILDKPGSEVRFGYGGDYDKRLLDLTKEKWVNLKSKEKEPLDTQIAELNSEAVQGIKATRETAAKIENINFEDGQDAQYRSNLIWMLKEMKYDFKGIDSTVRKDLANEFVDECKNLDVRPPVSRAEVEDLLGPKGSDVKYGPKSYEEGNDRMIEYLKEEWIGERVQQREDLEAESIEVVEPASESSVSPQAPAAPVAPAPVSVGAGREATSALSEDIQLQIAEVARVGFEFFDFSAGELVAKEDLMMKLSPVLEIGVLKGKKIDLQKLIVKFGISADKLGIKAEKVGNQLKITVKDRSNNNETYPEIMVSRDV